MNLKPLSTRTCLLLILFFGIAAYSNTLTSSFQFDDVPTILENHSLQPLNLAKIWSYHPPRFITDLSFAFNLYLAGFQTWSFHIFNLLIHLFTSLIFFQLTLWILRTPSMENKIPSSQQHLFALITALLFTAHPLQTEAVTYISQRATSLATLFYLAALWMYLRARLENARHYGAVFIFMLAAMFTKEISFTLPFAILLLELFFFPISEKEPLSKKLLRWTPFAAFLVIIPLLYLTNAYILVRDGGSINIIPPSTANTISRWDYLLTQFRVMRTYLRLLVFPVNQCIDYDYRLSSGWEDPDVWAAFSLLLSIFLLSFAFVKKNRLISFGILWFFLTLSVESTIIPLPDFILEHRLYLPMFGFALFSTSLLWMLSKSIKLFTAISLSVVVIFSSMTYFRNEVWKNPLTLWQDAVKNSPNKWRPYANLGTAYAEELSDVKTALLYYHKALKPGSYPINLLSNMATAYSRLGDSKASASYQALALSLTNSGDRALRGILYFNQVDALRNKGEMAGAINVLKKAIENTPQNHLFHVKLGELYRESGQEDAAIAAFRRAIELAPLSEDGYDALALFYKEKGDKQKALAVLVEYLTYKKKHKPLFGN